MSVFIDLYIKLKYILLNHNAEIHETCLLLYMINVIIYMITLINSKIMFYKICASRYPVLCMHISSILNY